MSGRLSAASCFRYWSASGSSGINGVSLGARCSSYRCVAAGVGLGERGDSADGRQRERRRSTLLCRQLGLIAVENRNPRSAAVGEPHVSVFFHGEIDVAVALLLGSNAPSLLEPEIFLIGALLHLRHARNAR